MGVVQKFGDTIQRYLEACTMGRIDIRAQMMQQRLDLTPMHIGAQGVLEDGAQQTRVLVANGDGSCA